MGPRDKWGICIRLYANKVLMGMSCFFFQGNYGYVFKGRRKFRDGRADLVALKRLVALGSNEDFKKEMDIMKVFVETIYCYVHQTPLEAIQKFRNRFRFMLFSVPSPRFEGIQKTSVFSRFMKRGVHLQRGNNSVRSPVSVQTRSCRRLF